MRPIRHTRRWANKATKMGGAKDIHMLNERSTPRTLEIVLLLAALAGSGCSSTTRTHEKSIRPGINDPFTNPVVEDWVERFEKDEREVYLRREEIVSVLDLKPGMNVADIGAGTGFFTMLFARKVGPDGMVYAVDIAENFITYIAEASAELGLTNVLGINNPDDSTGLDPDSVDVVFMAHTYHHFEYPKTMLKAIRSVLRPGGTVVLVGMERIENVSDEFVLNMVRSGKGTFTDEFKDAGFELIEEVPFSERSYILKFRERE